MIFCGMEGNNSKLEYFKAFFLLNNKTNYSKSEEINMFNTLLFNFEKVTNS